MSLSITVLGCSGSYAGPGGACSGFLVSGGGVSIVLDMGPGSLANLQRHIGVDDIDAVVLSHSHPDHWTDLAGLRTARKYGSGIDGLDVFGTEDNHDHAHDLCTNLHPTITWHTVADGDSFDVGGLRLRASRTDHYVETLAVRVDEPATGLTLAYSADTGDGWSLTELGVGIDLGLCESTYVTDAEVADVLHLSARQAGAMGAAAGVGQLVLTHLWPESDPEEHREVASGSFGRPVSIAAVGAVYEVGGVG